MQVPGVPRYPLKSSNGCQAPVLGSTCSAKRPNFCTKISKILCILSENFVCSQVCCKLGTRPLKALDPPLKCTSLLSELGSNSVAVLK